MGLGFITEFTDLFKTTFWEWWNDNTFRLAASLAFYTIFSLAPILLIAVSIASLVFSQESATEQVVREVQTLVGEEGAKAVRQVLRSVGRIEGTPMAIVTGLITLIMGSTAVFAELQSALNQIWDVRSNPQGNAVKGFIRDRMRSFSIVLVVGFLLLVSLVINAALAGVQTYLADWMPGIPRLWKTLNFITSLAVITLLFALIYKYLPDVRITWRDVTVGAFVTSMFFSAGKQLIGLYLGHMALGSTYGAAGSFVVLLIWVYYSALISFFGAEFTQVYARRYGSKIRPQAHAIRVGRKSDTI